MQLFQLKKILRLQKNIYVVDNSISISSNKSVEKFKSFMNFYYHAIVNPDIILTEDSFSKIINYVNGNKDIGMVIPKIVDEKRIDTKSLL